MGGNIDFRATTHVLLPEEIGDITLGKSSGTAFDDTKGDSTVRDGTCEVSCKT